MSSSFFSTENRNAFLAKVTGIIFAPLFFLVACTLGAIYYSETSSFVAVVREGEHQFTTMGKKYITDAVTPILEDLHFLADRTEAHLGDCRMGSRCIDQLRQEYFEFSAAHTDYDQIRYIDAEGMERLRINNPGDFPVNVPESGLQNKKGRYYFDDSLKLKLGQVYASPLDLNIENGQVEEPRKPMLRFGSPVFDHFGEKIGIVLINYRADAMIRSLDAAPIHAYSNLFLLNRDGYFLKAGDPALEWGFMFPEGKDLTFGNRFPEVWPEVRDENTGQAMAPAGLFTYGTIYPLSEEIVSASGSSEPTGRSGKEFFGNDYYWKIVSFVPEMVFADYRGRLLFRLALVGFCIWAALAALSLRLAWVEYERHLSRDRLEEAKAELENKVRERTAELQMSNQMLRGQIDERKEIQAALKESEEKYRSMMNAMHDFAYICGPDFTIRYMNPALIVKIGRNAIGEPCYRVMHERDERCENCFFDIIRAGKSHKSEVENPRDGRIYHVSHDPIFHEDGRISKMTIMRDITDIKMAEKERLYAEERYRNLLETMREGLFLINEEGVFTLLNPTFCKMLGYSRTSLIGRLVFELLDDENRRIFEAEALTPEDGTLSAFELEWTAVDGRKVVTLVSPVVNRDPEGGYAGLQALVVDITREKQATRERRVLENQLRQAQKMEALGTLAGGIAHDFNNILSAIIGFSELALDDFQEDSLKEENVKEILTAGNRAKELVHQILTFARQKEAEVSRVQVRLILKEAIKLIRSSFPSTIEIKQNIRSHSTVSADPTQIHQIVMNLCTNSAHAMEENGGTLLITLVDEFVADEPALARFGIEPGAYLKLTVSDTGEGIDPEILETIFEPYFTTKEPGKGTGMGLAMVHAIAVNCGGAVYVESRKGEGAAFTVLFPKIESEPTPEVTATNALPRGKERILIVDDEPAIVKMGGQTLRLLGYVPTTATDPMEALGLFEEDPEAFDLVITDLTMPRMTGDRLAERMREIRPDLPVIVCTGYSEKLTREKAEKIGIRAVLLKPMVKSELAMRIRQALDGDRPPIE